MKEERIEELKEWYRSLSRKKKREIKRNFSGSQNKERKILTIECPECGGDVKVEKYQRPAQKGRGGKKIAPPEGDITIKERSNDECELTTMTDGFYEALEEAEGEAEERQKERWYEHLEMEKSSMERPITEDEREAIERRYRVRGSE